MFRTMILPTIDVGHVHIPIASVTLDITDDGVWHVMIGAIPLDIGTAKVATTTMVFGMFRHHYRMVPVATLARKYMETTANHNRNKFNKFQISYYDYYSARTNLVIS